LQKPLRKLYYNMTMTVISVVVALAVGGIGTLNLIGDKLELKGAFWDAAAAAGAHFARSALSSRASSSSPGGSRCRSTGGWSTVGVEPKPATTSRNW
jgi:hypothetical protein